MHLLLKRQLNEYLTKDLESLPEIADFLKAINKTYENYEEKLSKEYRAIAISSEELYEVSRRLEKEAGSQNKILNSLENAIHSLTKHLNEKELYELDIENKFNVEHLVKIISNLVLQVSEITSEKEMLLKELEIQNQSLNNYIQMVSHDLKSPLGNINALMSWILDNEKDNFSDESKEYCTFVSLNLQRMDKLISGILNHSTLGKTKEDKISFKLDDLLKEIERTIYVPDNIIFEYADNLPNMLFEKSSLEQLFMNLFTNAVKATGKIEKGVVRIDYEPDELFWKFSVSDNGNGIGAQHQEGIFEMFRKLDSDNNATGIGLAIVKKIVLLYGGNVWLKSKENEGTTFYITLKKIL
ncbi:sensor histidine kinase [Maribacter arcticus]|uniref:sensor histidine kinase n=1 Tax=Maribacter arcticus TaxID=561365 RepID=UPI0030029DEB